MKTGKLLIIIGVSFAGVSFAGESLESAKQFYRDGQYFKAARYAFDSIEEEPATAPESYAWVTAGLVQSRLFHSASYFFLRTLQVGNQDAVRRVLTFTETLIEQVGADALRGALLKSTTLNQYDEQNRSAFLYVIGKEALLSGNERKAIEAFGSMKSSSVLWPFALQMRGTAKAILGQNDGAKSDFKQCSAQAESVASKLSSRKNTSASWIRNRMLELSDLHSRCIAGLARVLYQERNFKDADRVWDDIPKGSFVYTDILFEQAWNAFVQAEFNKTLGKLVSYKSPGLSFVFNSEVDVLRAQSYYALCLFSDVNSVVEDFNRKYQGIEKRIREFLKSNDKNLIAFYQSGKASLQGKLHSKDEASVFMNRFARTAYFFGIVGSEREIEGERGAIERFNLMQPGVSKNSKRGFPGFLSLVLDWRLNSTKLLGGAFIKNSMMDHHQVLIDDFEKIAFIKLDMLKKAKESLLYPTAENARSRGNVIPSRRDDQYYWSFNGEFWNDEFGDYIFGLESACDANG